MKKLILALTLLLGLSASAQQFSGGGASIPKPTSDGQCLLSSGGKWVWGACSGTASTSWSAIVPGTGSITAGTYTVPTGASLLFSGSGVIDSSAYKGNSTPTATEFGYLGGVTSAIQTQLNAKAGLSAPLILNGVGYSSTDAPSWVFRRQGAAQTSELIQFQTEVNGRLAGIDKTGVADFVGYKQGGTALNFTHLAAGNIPIGTYYVELGEIAAPGNPSAGSCRMYLDSTSHKISAVDSTGASCFATSGGSMTWPAGAAGIPNYSGSSTWGTSYSASNPIPTNFLTLPLSAIQNNGVTIIPSGGAVNLIPGTNMTFSVTGNAITFNSSGTAGLYTAANNATAVAGNKATSGTCTWKVNTSDLWESDCGLKIGGPTGASNWTAIADPGSPADGDDWYSTTTPNRRKFRAGTTTQIYAWTSDIAFGASLSNLSGDCTTSGSSAITCTKTNNVAFGSWATSVKAIPSGTVVGTSDAQALTNKDMSGAGNTWPTFNQNTTGSAAKLTTPRTIYGNNFDGSAALTQIIASTYGGTGNGFTKFSGPTTTEKTFTLPNANATLTQTIASGATAMPTAAVGANACSASATTDTATGAATSDAMSINYASDPTGVTGYGGGTSGGITIRYWVTANTVNFKLCNETGGSITPGALSVNWRITR